MIIFGKVVLFIHSFHHCPKSLARPFTGAVKIMIEVQPLTFFSYPILPHQQVCDYVIIARH
jgi:hypothetical protein